MPLYYCSKQARVCHYSLMHEYIPLSLYRPEICWQSVGSAYTRTNAQSSICKQLHKSNLHSYNIKMHKQQPCNWRCKQTYLCISNAKTLLSCSKTLIFLLSYGNCDNDIFMTVDPNWSYWFMGNIEHMNNINDIKYGVKWPNNLLWWLLIRQ